MSNELGAIADRITIILPWAGLLRAIATPEMQSLRQISNLCLPDASVEIVLSYDERRDATLDVNFLEKQHISALPEFYEQADLRVVGIEALSRRELSTYETTWASRLSARRDRQVWRIRACRTQSESA